MKIRNGFVSNSSSSSFVVKLKRKPKDANDLKSLLKIKDDDIDSYYPGFYCDDDVTVDEVLGYIFRTFESARYNSGEFHFELSDGDGSVGAVAEFGSWFRNVEHSVESNH